MPRIGALPGAIDTAVSSVARTSSGDSGVLSGWGIPTAIRMQLDVTAVAGVTPTLDVVVEDSLDGTNWNVIGIFAQKTAVGRQVINITDLFADRLRVRWTVGGTTPSFTFSVTAYSE